MHPVRFGLVGYGFGGRYFHAPLIASAPECDFVGVVTSSLERRSLVASEHPTVASFGSLAELMPEEQTALAGILGLWAGLFVCCGFALMVIGGVLVP